MFFDKVDVNEEEAVIIWSVL